ncbi:MAG: T9SS type A sorting domain-containing protein [Prolixibacteraceae bacterium]|nr:T9SS type A sorting domain-containing protein [Prolixibacteraceae bacterium]
MYKNEKQTCGIPRRCFLTQFTALVTGAALMGTGLKVLADVNDSWEDYSYCIFRCSLPCSYEAACPGCRSDQPYGQLDACTVRICVQEKGLPSCAHCADLATCNKKLWVNYPGQRTFALQKQKQWDLLSGNNELSRPDKGFSVYTNIAEDTVYIKNIKESKYDYKLIDMNGKIIQRNSSLSFIQKLDISNCAAGNYLIIISRDHRIQFSQKVIKSQ